MRNLAVVLLAVLWAGCSSSMQFTPSPTSTEGSLSPTLWPAGALDLLMKSANYFGPRPETNMSSADATGGGVVGGTSNALAAYAGFFSFSRGGNAMDACLVTAITQTVLAANSYVNVGGIADIVFVEGTTGKAYAIDGIWARPSAEQEAAQQQNRLGGSVLVGGFLAAVEEASARFGKLPFAALFDAAVYFAETGSPRLPLQYLSKAALNTTAEGRELLAQLVNTSATVFTQHELAAFLRTVQTKGAAHFYSGSFAQSAVDVSNANGGNLSTSDFRAYRPALQEASSLNFTLRGRQYTLSVQNTNLSFGAVEVIEQINLLVASSLLDDPFTPSSEIPFDGNATKWAAIVEMSFWSTVMSDMFLGSAYSVRHAVNIFADVFSAACPDVMTASGDTRVGLRFMECRTTPKLAETVWSLIAANATHFNIRLQSIFGPGHAPHRPRSHSDAVTAADASGNFCSVAHSINTGTMWGTGLFVEGVPLSNAGAGGLDQRFVVADDQMSGAALLSTPTRPLVVRDVATGDGFAFSAIGDSLSEITLNLVAELLSDPTSIAAVVSSPTFLLAGMTADQPFSVHINVCSNCTNPLDTWCPIANARTICANQAFLDQLPDWIAPLVHPLYGQARFEHSGPMTVSRRSVKGTRLEAAVTPSLNGASFGALWP